MYEELWGDIRGLIPPAGVRKVFESEGNERGLKSYL